MSSAVIDARSESLRGISLAVNPAVSVGIAKPRIPSSVCAQMTATSASVPFVIHILEPFSTQSVPSRFAVVRMTEMVCVSPEARITPGCAGLWTDEQGAAWGRITDFVHASSQAKIGVQIGHSGPKGSTKLMWEGIDQPLPEGNWPILSASAIPYFPHSQVPKAMDRADMPPPAPPPLLPPPEIISAATTTFQVMPMSPT